MTCSRPWRLGGAARRPRRTTQCAENTGLLVQPAKLVPRCSSRLMATLKQCPLCTEPMQNALPRTFRGLNIPLARCIPFTLCSPTTFIVAMSPDIDVTCTTHDGLTGHRPLMPVKLNLCVQSSELPCDTVSRVLPTL